MEIALNNMEHCLGEMQAWMNNNLLKLNRDKTEVMLFASKHNCKSLPDISLNVDGTEVESSSSVKNLGFITIRRWTWKNT
jgi:hypothetical protein